MANIHIGTSGWQYRHWAGPFYPAGLPQEDYLAYYAERFGAVEINNTFYRLPSADQVARWRKATPAGFVFACKASRYITHMKKLSAPAESTRQYVEVVKLLGDKLGPILFQLPPSWHVNVERLATFLEALPVGHRVAFEFRDRTWFAPEVFKLLRRHNAALCVYELNRVRSPIKLTADFAYVRLHGPGAAYRGTYDGRALLGWARRFRNWRDGGIDVYCFFDNDEKGYAARDAARLQHMLEARPPKRPRKGKALSHIGNRA